MTGRQLEPSPAGDIPDATGAEAFSAAFDCAKDASVPFVCVARVPNKAGWTVTVDTITAPGWPISETVAISVFAAAAELARAGFVRGGSATPRSTVLHGLATESAARSLAAALHAAVYNDLDLLRNLVGSS